MDNLRIGTTADLPDEYGLSSDSLRGSHHFVQPHLVGSEGLDPLTGRPNPRDPLSRTEIRALQDVGILVDEDGYEREPEPVVAVAPIPTVQPRVRPSDRAPAGETQPTPNLPLAVDDKSNPAADDRPYVAGAPAVPQSGLTSSVVAPSTNPPTAVSASAIPPYSGERPTHPADTTPEPHPPVPASESELD
jgi:hypothetical protein